MKKLRGMEQDGTFAQDEQVNRIVRLSSGQKTFCFDLSSATDRFPISYQVVILEQMFGSEFAYTWKSIMVERDYSYKDISVR
jgi:hypothetical protein